jgi:N-acetylneuraminic acid mutarotase
MRKFVLLSLFAITYFISFSQWVSKPPALEKRSETSSVVYNGKIYTFLGFRDSLLNSNPSAEVYDPVAETWTRLTSIDSSKAVTHQGVVLIDDDVWHIGGRTGKNPGPLTAETWIYNITTDTWRQGPNIKDPNNDTLIKWGGGGAALLGRTIHLFGGFTNIACKADQSKYHLTLDVDEYKANPATKWKNELAPMPIPRNHLSTVVQGGKIYALGGQFGHDCSGGIDQTYSHVYNPTTNKWTELPRMALPRSHAEGGSFQCDGKLYIVAGQSAGVNNANSCNRVTTYDPETKVWFEDSVVMKLPNKYEGISAKIVGNTFVISHGGLGKSQSPRNTTYSRTVTRNPIYKFTFPNDTITINVREGDSVVAKTLLATISEPMNFEAAMDGLAPTIELLDTAGAATSNGTYLRIKVITNYVDELGNSHMLPRGTTYLSLAAGNDTNQVSAVVRVNVLPVAQVSVANTSITETATSLSFTVSLDTNSTYPVTVNYVTEHITSSTNDVVLKNGTITFPVGSRSQRVTLTTKDDAIDEINETLRIRLTNVTNATFKNTEAIGTINDNDSAPTMWIYDTTTNEKSLKAVIRVTLNKPSGKTIKASYNTKTGTAVSGSDYIGYSANVVFVTFNPGEVTKYITITLKTDAIKENVETFYIQLRYPVNATIGRVESAVKIYDASTNTGVISAATLEKEPRVRLIIQPNPSYSHFTLVTDSQTDLRVFDVTGRLIDNKRINQTTQFGSSYAKGVYFAEIRQLSERVVVRLVKN